MKKIFFVLLYFIIFIKSSTYLQAQNTIYIELFNYTNNITNDNIDYIILSKLHDSISSINNLIILNNDNENTARFIIKGEITKDTKNNIYIVIYSVIINRRNNDTINNKMYIYMNDKESGINQLCESIKSIIRSNL